jgi:hypothetical protein
VSVAFGHTGGGGTIVKALWPDEPLGAAAPPGAVERLLYNRPSDTLVVLMARTAPPAHRLYFRRLPGKAYSSVGVGHELESQEDAHSCDSAPLLIFNEMRFREPVPPPAHVKAVLRGKQPPPVEWAADWLGIRRFNLETGEDLRVLDEGSLRVPPPYTSGWVSQILSVSADGSGAVCVVGLTPGGEVTYFVYELSFSDGLGRQIAELPQVFL